MVSLVLDREGALKVNPVSLWDEVKAAAAVVGLLVAAMVTCVGLGILAADMEEPRKFCTLLGMNTWFGWSVLYWIKRIK